MIPEPLHPAVVHFPIALAFLAPLWTVFAVLAIHKKWLPGRAWVAVVLLQALLMASALVAEETGEGDKEKVATVVAERVVEIHEERAEVVVILTEIALASSVLGLFTGRLGLAARLLTVALALALVPVTALAGKTGGALIYEHGGAQVHWRE